MAGQFSGKAPIYDQIVQKICSQIVRGDLHPGDKLPSVRELAVEYGVNPNTAKRVYTELEQLGISEVKRGQGTFVTGQGERLTSLRRQLKAEKVKTFVTEMKDMGFSHDEMLEGLKAYFEGGGEDE